jgi:hypothetical protein
LGYALRGMRLPNKWPPAEAAQSLLSRNVELAQDQ